MTQSQIFWPVLCQVALTVVLYFVLAVRKARAIRDGQVDRRAAALDNRVWPESVVKVSNNIANQFELPLLFYTVCVVLFLIEGIGMVAVGLAWAFFVSRCLHALAHIRANHVPLRMRLFLVGVVVLILLLGLAFWELGGLYRV